MKKLWEELINDPQFIVDICDHVANGGTVIDLAKVYEVPFSRIMRWVRADSDRLKQYNAAMFDRSEWIKERVLQELGHIATSDMVDMFDDNGAVLHPKQWPPALRRAVAGIEVKELFDIKGTLIGYGKKIKLWEKTKGLELTGKTLAMFVEKHEHTVDKTLEELILESYKKGVSDSGTGADQVKQESKPSTDTEGKPRLQSASEVSEE